MLLGDLLSLQQLKIPVKIVVFNNSALSFVELEMKATGFLENGTTLVNPQFAELAKTAGVHGIRVEDPADVEDGIAAALSLHCACLLIRNQLHWKCAGIALRLHGKRAGSRT